MYIKTYIFNHCYSPYLVLLTMDPRNNPTGTVRGTTTAAVCARIAKRGRESTGRGRRLPQHPVYGTPRMYVEYGTVKDGWCLTTFIPVHLVGSTRVPGAIANIINPTARAIIIGNHS